MKMGGQVLPSEVAGFAVGGDDPEDHDAHRVLSFVDRGT